MTDGVKVDAHEPLFELVHMELLDVETLEGGGQDNGGVARADHVTAKFKDVCCVCGDDTDVVDVYYWWTIV